MNSRINQIIDEQINNLIELKNNGYEKQIIKIADIITKSMQNQGKLLICGNGGSAADSQHIAAELIGRFVKERKSLPAIALTTDSSILTCMGNDYGFDDIFSRQVEGLAKKNDVLIAISTSGNSKNVIKAVQKAKELGVITIGLLGKTGGLLKDICDFNITFPYKETARIQEHHMMSYHIICELVEEKMVNYGKNE